MDLDAIAVFVKVVETGSFSGAARLLKMPKTTVSAKVASLERRLGLTLIQRTTRKLHVTDAGQLYFRHCAVAIQEIEKGEAEISAEQGKPRGLLKLTAPADLGHSLLPRLVSKYVETYPETEVELIVTNRIVDLVGEGVDLAIRAGELKDSTLVARKFFDVRAGFWASPAYLKKQGVPQHPRDLAKHCLILHTSAWRQNMELTDDKTTFVTAFKPRIRSDDFESIRGLLVLKEGIGWLPEFLIPRAAKANQLVPVLPQWRTKQTGAFSFVYPGQKFSLPKVRAFIELASQLIQKDGLCDSDD